MTRYSTRRSVGDDDDGIDTPTLSPLLHINPSKLTYGIDSIDGRLIPNITNEWDACVSLLPVCGLGGNGTVLVPVSTTGGADGLHVQPMVLSTLATQLERFAAEVVAAKAWINLDGATIPSTAHLGVGAAGRNAAHSFVMALPLAEGGAAAPVYGVGNAIKQMLFFLPLVVGTHTRSQEVGSEPMVAMLTLVITPFRRQTTYAMLLLPLPYVAILTECLHLRKDIIGLLSPITAGFYSRLYVLLDKDGNGGTWRLPENAWAGRLLLEAYMRAAEHATQEFLVEAYTADIAVMAQWCLEHRIHANDFVDYATILAQPKLAQRLALPWRLPVVFKTELPQAPPPVYPSPPPPVDPAPPPVDPQNTSPPVDPAPPPEDPQNTSLPVDPAPPPVDPQNTSLPVDPAPPPVDPQNTSPPVDDPAPPPVDPQNTTPPVDDPAPPPVDPQNTTPPVDPAPPPVDPQNTTPPVDPAPPPEDPQNTTPPVDPAPPPVDPQNTSPLVDPAPPPEDPQNTSPLVDPAPPPEDPQNTVDPIQPMDLEFTTPPEDDPTLQPMDLAFTTPPEDPTLQPTNLDSTSPPANTIQSMDPAPLHTATVLVSPPTLSTMSLACDDDGRPPAKRYLSNNDEGDTFVVLPKSVVTAIPTNVNNNTSTATVHQDTPTVLPLVDKHAIAFNIMEAYRPVETTGLQQGLEKKVRLLHRRLEAVVEMVEQLRPHDAIITGYDKNGAFASAIAFLSSLFNPPLSSQ
jgi:hypothetical protein